MKNILILPLTALTMLFLSGCLFSTQQHPTLFYDLQLPEVVKTDAKFVISSVDNDTPARSRMLYRQQNNRIIQDSYHCWVQPPERMFQRYMTLAYPVKGALQEMTGIRVTITAFEFDRVSHQAVLAIKYALKKDHKIRSGSFLLREKITSDTPDEFAAAMNRAIRKAGSMLAEAAAEKP